MAIPTQRADLCSTPLHDGFLREHPGCSDTRGYLALTRKTLPHLVFHRSHVDHNVLRFRMRLHQPN